MRQTALDHVVIMAATLSDGINWVHDRLGVVVPLGGKHQEMGTHNGVMSLGPGVYLEVIAIDPDATPPTHTRWFTFDDPNQLRRLERYGPRLAHWVGRTSNINETLDKATVDLGVATPMARDELRWKIAIRTDGHLLEDGLVPTVIEWPLGPHPSTRMADKGVRLEQLTLHHPEPKALQAIIASLDLDHCVSVRRSDHMRLMARLSTPNGIATLD